MTTPHLVDVSGTEYIPGVTNFTAENLFDTLLAIGNPDSEVVTLKLPNDVWETQFNNRMIDMCNGYFKYQMMDITFGFFSAADGIEPPVYDSHIYVEGMHAATLRTREF